MSKSHTYKDAGVDIKAGEELVDSIKDLTRSTHTSRVIGSIGGFGGLFRADFKNYEKPVLVSSVDGVGTKLIVAFKAQQYDTVGQDLVNHCVNDIAVCGAEPLFFLDYFSTGKLKRQTGYEVVKGFSIACRENGCALIGGETAEMPDIYNEGEFDLAGTIVGVVDEAHIIDGSNIQKGDVLLGFESSGLHTNGYSLARKVLFSTYDFGDIPEGFNRNIGEELLQIHRSYLPLISSLKTENGVHGFAHITGGGIPGNVKRLLKEDQKMNVDWDSWQRPPDFDLIQKTGNVPEEDMRTSFNLGIGLVAVVDPASVDNITQKAESLGESVHTIGSIG